MRAIVNMVSTEVLGRSIPLPDFPVRKDVVGIGLSDWEGYATRLAEIFSYTNTYFHQEPRLDISHIDDDQTGRLDFLISAEVFEHVVPPVSQAFTNAHRLLKPGGVLLLMVPYAPTYLLPTTTEHFPDLYEYSVTQDDTGRYILTNRTRDGTIQVFDTLVFHGGQGATLEMRVFSEGDLLEHLRLAGFTNIKVKREPVFEFGIYWPQAWSLPITARA
jgi:SAM-dependent methyltransferase